MSRVLSLVFIFSVKYELRSPAKIEVGGGEEGSRRVLNS